MRNTTPNIFVSLLLSLVIFLTACGETSSPGGTVSPGETGSPGGTPPPTTTFTVRPSVSRAVPGQLVEIDVQTSSGNSSDLSGIAFRSTLGQVFANNGAHGVLQIPQGTAPTVVTIQAQKNGATVGEATVMVDGPVAVMPIPADTRTATLPVASIRISGTGTVGTVTATEASSPTTTLPAMYPQATHALYLNFSQPAALRDGTVSEVVLAFSGLDYKGKDYLFDATFYNQNRILRSTLLKADPVTNVVRVPVTGLGTGIPADEAALPVTLAVQGVEMSAVTFTAAALRPQAIADQSTTVQVVNGLSVQTGLWAINDIQADYAAISASCTAHDQTLRPSSSIISYAPGEPITTSKTPLIFVHGWQSLSDQGDVLRNLPSDLVEEYRLKFLLRFEEAARALNFKKSPGLCTWKDDLKQLQDSGALSNYQVYVFGYNSYDSIASNIGRLQTFVSHMDSPTAPVVVAHSMGGIIAQGVEARAPGSFGQIISLGSPYLGTTALVCRELSADGQSCAQATINPDMAKDEWTFDVGANLTTFQKNFAQTALPLLTQFQGTRDLTWKTPVSFSTFAFTFPTFSQTVWTKDNPGLPNLPSVLYNSVSLYGQVTGKLAEDAELVHDLIFSRGDENDGIVPIRSACLSSHASTNPDNGCTDSRFATVPTRIAVNHMNMTGTSAIDALKRALKTNHLAVVRYTLTVGDTVTPTLTGSANGVTYLSDNPSAVTVTGTTIRAAQPVSNPVAVYATTADGVKRYVAYVTVKAAAPVPGPVTVVPITVVAKSTTITASTEHSLVLKSDGTLWAFGHNRFGELGDTTTTTRYSPVMIMSGVASVSAGGGHSLALKSDGTLWAFGYNSSGQLGDGTTTNRYSPVMVMGGVSSISAGRAHSLALKSDGTLWAFGDNSYGQLGDGTTTNRYSPVMIMSGVASVSAGGGHSLALKSDGMLWAFGWNRSGQLGDGTATNRYSPVMVVSGVVSVSAGEEHSLSLKADGTLWAFGRSSSGELGDGSTADQYSPVMVVSGVASVSAGFDHSLALKSDGTLWAFGYNLYGQLGDGTTKSRYIPVMVMSGVAFPR